MPKKKKSEVSKEPPDFSRKPLAYKTIKTSLKSILKDPQTHQPLFNNIVLRCNKIVTEAYQLIRLFCLQKYHRREPCPTLDETFFRYALSAVGTFSSRGRAPKNGDLKNELLSFYDSELRSLLAHSEKIDISGYSTLIPYLAIQMHTAVHNNLKVHFLTRLFRFINKTVSPFENGLSKEESVRERNALKGALINNDVTLLPNRYAGWMAQHRPHILPGEWDKTLPYDIKANPERYLFCSFYMNEILEREGHKLFQPLSLRNEIIPHYITFDNASILTFFVEEEKSRLRKAIKENREEIWASIFNLGKKVFRQNGYNFNFTMQTDGIGVSLLFIHKDYDEKTLSKSHFSDGEYPFHYVEELHDFQLEELKSKNIVGADPGKYNLLYMADGEGKKLRYTAFQRRTETLTKRNSRILLQEKRKNGVVERESSLSDQNSKTVDYERFKNYLRAKNLLNAELSSFYERDLFRKMKWRHFTYTQRSEDRFLNKIGETFGKDCVIAYGNWNRSSQMKNFVPTKGIGLRKLISRKFLTLSVDEFRTSKLCCHCHDELSYLKIKKGDQNKKVFRCLVCKECGGSESKNTMFVTRDLNSALNIRKMVLHWIRERIRPSEFSRSRSENS